MAQLINHLRNNIFVNPPTLPLLCEISEALHLAQPVGLSQLCQHNFEHNRMAKASSTMPA